jgi:hypothetical protein
MVSSTVPLQTGLKTVRHRYVFAYSLWKVANILIRTRLKSILKVVILHRLILQNQIIDGEIWTGKSTKI